MLRRRRPLARAAMLGGAGYVAYRGGKSAQEQSDHEAEQDAQLTGLQQQGEAGAPQRSPYATPQQTYPTPPPTAAAPADSAAQRIEALSKLKELLDAGVVSQAEFDAEKQKLLQG